MVFFGNQDCLDGVIVLEGEQELMCAVLILLQFFNRKESGVEVIPDFLPVLDGNIAPIINVLSVFEVEPKKNLIRHERLESKFFKCQF